MIEINWEAEKLSQEDQGQGVGQQLTGASEPLACLHRGAVLGQIPALG